MKALSLPEDMQHLTVRRPNGLAEFVGHEAIPALSLGDLLRVALVTDDDDRCTSEYLAWRQRAAARLRLVPT